MSKWLDKQYRRVGSRAWNQRARKCGWGLEDIAWAIRRWQAKHPDAPSPYLLCRECDAPVLDPVLKKFKGKKDGDLEIGDMLDHSPESYARATCYSCGGWGKRP